METFSYGIQKEIQAVHYYVSEIISFAHSPQSDPTSRGLLQENTKNYSESYEKLLNHLNTNLESHSRRSFQTTAPVPPPTIHNLEQEFSKLKRCVSLIRAEPHLNDAITGSIKKIEDQMEYHILSEVSKVKTIMAR